MKKRIVALLLIACMAMTACTSNAGTVSGNDTNGGASQNEVSGEEAPVQENSGDRYLEYQSMTPEEIVASLTLEQKVAQMLQPAIYYLGEGDMKAADYGSVLSQYGDGETYTKWREIVGWLQDEALHSDAGIPFIYGQDDVHGVNYCSDAVYFPQNIGMGAANDPDLMYEIGLATADEAKLCYMLWNFAPCLAQSVDPRWGRTYESYGADLDIITSLGVSYTEGLIDGGVVACAKHFFADGNVVYGTGENSDSNRIIDRGDSVLTQEEIDALLAVYQAEIDAGVQTIMISHSSLNGLKMHENAEYIQYLKNEMGFEGFIVSDWNSVQNTSGATYEEQIITSVNAGIDMLMEVETYDEVMEIIVNAVNDGRISEDRINDAVTRIIRVKMNVGIFDDPMCENLETVQSETGSDEYRELARRAVQESLVLVKNDGAALPLTEGTKIYISGPAASDDSIILGGWSLNWLGASSNTVNGVTNIYEGFTQVAEEYGVEIVDNIDDADTVILVVGEQTYAEWYGDTADMELCGDLGLDGNEAAIEEAAQSGKPTVACIVAGRNVIIDEYVDNWDAVVMCYLPGSEGEGVADVLCGAAEFTGKLPSPWYSSIDQIGTDENWLPMGYGLTY